MKFLSGKCLTLFPGEEESGLDIALFTGGNTISERPVVKQTKQLQLSTFLTRASWILQCPTISSQRSVCATEPHTCLCKSEKNWNFRLLQKATVTAVDPELMEVKGLRAPAGIVGQLSAGHNVTSCASFCDL